MSKRNIVKKSTVDQIERLIKEHGVVGMMDTDEYKNMINRNFLNKLEKDNMKTIIVMVNDGKSYDEIRFMVEGGETTQSKSDPVEQETETLINMMKYVKDKKPEIIIGGVDDVEEEPEEVERVEAVKAEVNDNTVQEEEPADNVILLKDIVEEKKVDHEEKNIPVVEATANTTEDKKPLPKWDPPKYEKRKKQPAFELPNISVFTAGLRKYH